MKKRFKLLVAYDSFESGKKVPGTVMEMARHLRAEVILFHAVPPASGSLWRQGSSEDLQESRVRERREQLDQIGRDFGEVEVTTVVTCGDAGAEIVSAAIEHQCDLVVVFDRPNAKKGGFSETTAKLLRECPTPVWAARMSTETYPRRILAAVDVASEEAETRLLSEHIVETAIVLGRHQGVSTWLVHAWAHWGEQPFAAIGQRAPDEERQVSDEERQHRRELEQLVERLDVKGVDLHIDLTTGDPLQSIPGAIDALGIDLLILGTVSRTGLPGLLKGNTAERVLNRVGCSVLVVKPRGFLSPLVVAADQEST